MMKNGLISQCYNWINALEQINIHTPVDTNTVHVNIYLTELVVREHRNSKLKLIPSKTLTLLCSLCHPSKQE